MMFGDIAKQFLTMMGHSASIPGAILANEVAPYLHRLESTLASNNDSTASESGEKASEELEVSLRKRALPLIDLLKSALQNNSDVMWK